ncbi:predicted protein [Botrytis cinerea T4]|uniref:Uncharacterized protein n=1 Tax=Botryotinia fuckeliana (strain T4) TaxID=999810 RepID=G2YHT8_BOTF4|nr:predicted protein [Botrytis cinerea T4]
MLTFSAQSAICRRKYSYSGSFVSNTNAYIIGAQDIPPSSLEMNPLTYLGGHLDFSIIQEVPATT